MDKTKIALFGLAVVLAATLVSTLLTENTQATQSQKASFNGADVIGSPDMPMANLGADPIDAPDKQKASFNGADPIASPDQKA